MKKQTHLHLGWPEGKYTFNQSSFFVWTTPLTVGYLFIVLQQSTDSLFMDNVIYN